MKIISWNVNGIRAIHKKGLFVPVLTALKPDIICLQETKAEKHQSEIDLLEYEELWNSAERKGYSGTAIFTKQIPLSVRYNFSEDLTRRYTLKDGYGNLNAEGRVLTIEYKDFFLVNVYTPNAKPDLSRLTLRHEHWDPAFLVYCTALEKQKPVVFCGDLNVAHTPDDLANPKQNEGEHGFTQEEREGLDKIIEAGFIDTFRIFTHGSGHYTWWSNFSNARARNVGWRIDYFFVSDALVSKVQRSAIHTEFTGSDHCPISLDLSL